MNRFVFSRLAGGVLQVARWGLLVLLFGSIFPLILAAQGEAQTVAEQSSQPIPVDSAPVTNDSPTNATPVTNDPPGRVFEALLWGLCSGVARDGDE